MKRIAITGMSGRFPGADNVHQYWSNIRLGVESITRAAFQGDGGGCKDQDGGLRVFAGGLIQGIESFDADFFGFTRREAERADPQQRLLLEECWRALEDSGYSHQSSDVVGLFTAASVNTYSRHVSDQFPASLADSDLETEVGLDRDFVATRIGYKLGLKGPCLNVQSACSSSLAAVHLACQSLLSQECDVALVGATSIKFLDGVAYTYWPGGILSPDGYCRPFDASANGTVPGDGVCVVVLRRFEDACKNGNQIYSVILGSSINNDGSVKTGYTAPSIDGQIRVIRSALNAAGVDAESLSYIETHGTGTIVGDPIEIEALLEALGPRNGAASKCALGATKANIGHLDVASGLAGLIKVSLAINAKEIPPVANFQSLNSEIDLNGSNVYVPISLHAWERQLVPRRAGISSFGIGGTNVHLIIEEAPEGAAASPVDEKPCLLLLSAKTAQAVEAQGRQLAKHVEGIEKSEVGDVVRTLTVGRNQFAWRMATVCGKFDNMSACIADRVGKPAVHAQKVPSVVFMFPGQGVQYAGMARQLYYEETAFRNAVEDCLAKADSKIVSKIRKLLLTEHPTSQDVERLKQTEWSQPAIFIVEYALARLLHYYGVQPAAVIGHSLGEYVAAVVAGVLAPEDALALVICRSRLMQVMKAGAMVAVGLNEPDLRPRLEAGLCVAAVNSPGQTVVSGDGEAIVRFSDLLAGDGVPHFRLETSHAFHSPMMEGIESAFRKELGRVKFKRQNIPLVSNLTGVWASDEELATPDYWIAQALNPVRFSDGINTLSRLEPACYIEVGPGKVLTNLAKETLDGRTEGPLIVSLGKRQGSDAYLDFLEALGKAWERGVNIKYDKAEIVAKGRIRSLPPYPFERRPYWLPPLTQSTSTRQENILERIYSMGWEKTSSSRSYKSGGRCLIIGGARSFDLSIGKALAVRGAEIVYVREGSHYAQADNMSFTVRPDSREDFEAVLRVLQAKGWQPQYIFHALSLADSPVSDGFPDSAERWELASRRGARSLLALTQAWSRTMEERQVSVVFAGHRYAKIHPDDAVLPESSAVAGLALVIPQELTNIGVRFLDLPESAFGQEGDHGDILGVLAEDILDPEGLRVIAYRQGARWMQVVRSAVAPTGTLKGRAKILRSFGTYVVIGGLEGLGYTVAKHLLSSYRAQVVIVDTSERGPDGSLSSQEVAFRLETLRTCGRSGALAVVHVTEEEAVRSALESLPAVDAIIHAARIFKDAFRLVEDMNAADLDRQYRRKVFSFLQVFSLLRNKAPRAVVLFSSLSSVLGGIGNGAYASANSCIDAIARARHSAEGDETKWISIAWDAWHLPHLKEAPSIAGTELEAYALSEQKGLETFEEIVDGEYRENVIVADNLSARRAMWVDRVDPQATNAYSSPAPGAKQTGSNGETMPELAAIWKELLGVTSVSSSDDFFRCGGHSLLAIKLLARIRQQCRVQLTIADIFDNPSFGAISEFIAKRRQGNGAEEDNETPFAEHPQQKSGLQQNGVQTSARTEPVAGSVIQERKTGHRATMQFSLFFFSVEDEKGAVDNYDLLLEAAKYADERGFHAIWTPERHFHPFGGAYPAPAVLSAAVATVTKRIRINPGSVIMPIHHPVRVAEQWSVVDNLSRGRVGIALASGWNREDFALVPGSYDHRHNALKEGINVIRRFWQGEQITLSKDENIAVTLHPRPVQPNAPLWITAAGNPETFRLAGELGVGVLAHIFGHELEELEKKITIYRAAWSAAGHPEGDDWVTVMVHAHIGEDIGLVRERCRKPFKDYQRNFLNLVTASSGEKSNGAAREGVESTQDMDDLLEIAFQKYFRTGSLMGTVVSGVEMSKRLQAIGVDEIACLVDFGLNPSEVLDGLQYLSRVKDFFIA